MVREIYIFRSRETNRALCAQNGINNLEQNWLSGPFRVTRSRKQVFQWPPKKDWCPPNIVWLIVATVVNNEHLPFNMTLPKTDESLVEVEQFHLLLTNCFWHSVTPIFAPLTTETMTSGCVRHSFRWRPMRPGMLSHMTPVPTSVKAWTGNWLRYLEIWN